MRARFSCDQGRCTKPLPFSFRKLIVDAPQIAKSPNLATSLSHPWSQVPRQDKWRSNSFQVPVNFLLSQGFKHRCYSTCIKKAMFTSTQKCSAVLRPQGTQPKHNQKIPPYPHQMPKTQVRVELLTSSSLYQERFSAVRTNQYSLEPPFMIPMLLMVSQPFRMT